MRVAVVNRHLAGGVGGSELQCDLVARGLAARGHAVTYLAVGLDAASAASAASAGEGLPYDLVAVARDPAAIVAAVGRVGADVVYWRFNRNHLTAVARGLAAIGVPLVFAVAHEDDLAAWTVRRWPRRGGVRDHLAEARARLVHRRERRGLALVDALVQQRADLAGRVPAPLEVVVPNALDPSSVPFPWPRPFVAWVGSLKAPKRPEACVPLAAALAPHGIDVVMVGPLVDPAYVALTRPDPAHPNLHHVGTLTPAEVTGMAAAARVLVLTCVPEGFPNVLLQAWAGGTPAVSLGFDPGGVIAREDLGTVCGDDPARFHAAVVALATDPASAAAVGVRARAYVAAHHEPARVAAELEAVLAAVVAARAGRVRADG